MSRRAWVRQIMGMPISIHIRGRDVDGELVGSGVAEAFAALNEADRLFSTYRAESEVSRIRRGELSLADADPLVREVVALCGQAAVVTGGAFTDRLPDAEAGPGGPRRFDPTGLVKGWAADRAGARLAAIPGHTFCLNAGGDVLVGGDLAAVDDAVDATAWRVGIEDPRDRSRIAEVVAISQGAVATSGTAARGAHLFSPWTHDWVQQDGSVSVVASSLMWADVWATALFVGPAGLSDQAREHPHVVRVVRL